MKILAFEFSSSQRSVAIAVDGRVRGRAEESEGRETHALAMIQTALSQAGLEREEIECIAVGLGPGSYAGVRIAIALAQGWQLARGVKLLGISSADGVAAQAQAAGWHGRMELVVDAQRHGLYCASYEISETGWRAVTPFRSVASGASDPCASLTRPSGTLSPSEGERDGVRGPSDACANTSFIVRLDAHGWISRDERILCPDAAMLAQLAAGRTDFVSGEKLEPIYLVETTFVKAPPPRIIS